MFSLKYDLCVLYMSIEPIRLVKRRTKQPEVRKFRWSLFVYYWHVYRFFSFYDFLLNLCHLLPTLQCWPHFLDFGVTYVLRSPFEIVAGAAGFSFCFMFFIIYSVRCFMEVSALSHFKSVWLPHIKWQSFPIHRLILSFWRTRKHWKVRERVKISDLIILTVHVMTT